MKNSIKNLFVLSRPEKMPSRKQWGQIFKVVNKKEKISLCLLLLMFLVSGSYLFFNFYFNHTEIKPSEGGIHIEGIVGQPGWIQPIYAADNDADRDLTEILFSGLMKYNSKGEIIPDLAADNYEIKEDGRVYELYLKNDIFWHDKSPLTIDDVIFTVKTIQDPNFKSSERAKWLGIEMEKIGENGIRFKLKSPYPAFLETLTQKIMPKHLWQDIPATNFPLATYNLQPIGSGPYQFKKMTLGKNGKIASIELEKFSDYFGKEAYIPKLTFIFFDNESDLILAAKLGQINGLSIISSKNQESFKTQFFREYYFTMPRYFAVFFNGNQVKILADKNIRQALNYATDKNKISEIILSSGSGQTVESPVLPELFGLEPPETIYEFNQVKAEEILDKAGFTKNENGLRVKIVRREKSTAFKTELKQGSSGEEVRELQRCLAQDPEVYPEAKITGTFGTQTKTAVIKFQEKYRKDILDPNGLKEGTGVVSKATQAKLNEICDKVEVETTPLKFSLVTVDQEELSEVAEILKDLWSQIGIELEIQKVPASQIEQDYIKSRNYGMLLFGEVLGTIPDPYPFWHSSQKVNPGLNLAIYESKEADKLLEDNRKSQELETRKDLLQKFQNILVKDSPALFLYNPDYAYFASNEIKGINTGLIADPSKRFSEVGEWYIKTERAWK